MAAAGQAPARTASAWAARWRRFAEAMGVVLFAALFGVFVVQIGARFLFDRPLPWTDEAVVVLYIWAILWAAAFVVPDREHVAFDLVLQGRRQSTQRVMGMAGAALLGGLCLWSLPGVTDYILFMRRESTPVLGLPMDWVDAPFALLLATLVWRNGVRLWRLLGRRWREALGDAS